MSRILLFIPAYNCEKQITRVLSQIDEEVLTYISKIIVVNNRSTDNTEKAVLDFIRVNQSLPVTLLRNNENYGLGGSHKVAFNYALEHDYSYVIVLHGDDQGSIKDLIPIFRTGLSEQHDCCLGARFMKGSTLPGYSGFRTFGNRVFNLLFSIICGKRIYDLGSGLNLYKTSMLASKYYHKFPDNLTFNVCMVMAIGYYKQNALFFPISWREDDQVSNAKLFSQALKTISMLLDFFFNRKKFMKKELRTIPHEAYIAKEQDGAHYGD